MINFIDDIVIVKDPAGQELTRSRAEKTVKAALFQTTPQAIQIAQRFLAANGWPGRTISLSAKRSLFRLQPGDPFVYSSVRYGISGVVYRVATVSEENLESGEITITAVLDYRYLAATPLDIYTPPLPPTPDPVGTPLGALTEVFAIEPVYPGYGDELIYLGTMAGRVTGQETGYYVYFSIDGESYSLLGSVDAYSVIGTLTAEYSDDTYEIDDEVGIYCTIIMDAAAIHSITRAQLFGLSNLAVINDEIISFQTITPTGSTNEYRLTGVMRARYDSERDTHDIGDKLIWMGNGAGTFLMDQSLIHATRYIKLIPFNSDAVGLLEDATPIELLLSGRARKPYRPTNLKCNGSGINSKYTDDCILTWQPRLRTEGAGFGDADSVVDASPTWEGYFEVWVHVGGFNVRTATAIDALTWTYTEAMNIADNGSLASSVTFYVVNYRVTGGMRYASTYVALEVLKA